jgi:hypothetical protein
VFAASAQMDQPSSNLVKFADTHEANTPSTETSHRFQALRADLLNILDRQAVLAQELADLLRDLSRLQAELSKHSSSNSGGGR